MTCGVVGYKKMERLSCKSVVQQKKGEAGEKLVALTATSVLPLHNSLLHEDFTDNWDPHPQENHPESSNLACWFL